MGIPSVSWTHQPEEKTNTIMTYNQISAWKKIYGYWKSENGSLTCFEHQSNITVVVLLHKSFFPAVISLLNEWSINKIAICLYKTTIFS